jgi:uncharacterized protein YjbJ (UPF0337 family)
MSVAKVKTIQKAQKDQGKCGSCGVELPKGSSYIWWTMGFRSNHKYKRCTKSECFPKPSTRETSKFATILAAQETFAENIDSLTEVGEIEGAVADVATAVGEVRDEYQDALDSWENGNEQLQEKVDHYEGQASELESWTWDGDEEPRWCDEHEDASSEDRGNCDDCMSAEEEWIESVRDSAREAVDNIEQM